jgi:hypothetical protein
MSYRHRTCPVLSRAEEEYQDLHAQEALGRAPPRVNALGYVAVATDSAGQDCTGDASQERKGNKRFKNRKAGRA